jgi:hypothetical protein
MSKTVMVFFTLMLVLASVFIAGCSSLPFSGTPTPTETPRKIATIVTGEPTPDLAQRFRFEDTLSTFNSPDILNEQEETPVNESQQNVSMEKHIQYIYGADLDENGDAGSWTFIVEHGNQYSIITYSIRGTTITDTPGMIKRPEIFTDQIVTPRGLFEKNHAVIFDTTRTGTAVARDISLSGGNYTLSISGKGTPRILVFDAKTGALTSSND